MGRQTKRVFAAEQKLEAVIRLQCGEQLSHLARELGVDHTPIHRWRERAQKAELAALRRGGQGSEAQRGWVKQARIDQGEIPGRSSGDAAKLRDLEREVRELKRARESAEACHTTPRLTAGIPTRAGGAAARRRIAPTATRPPRLAGATPTQRRDDHATITSTEQTVATTD